MRVLLLLVSLGGPFVAGFVKVPGPLGLLEGRLRKRQIDANALWRLIVLLALLQFCPQILLLRGVLAGAFLGVDYRASRQRFCLQRGCRRCRNVFRCLAGAFVDAVASQHLAPPGERIVAASSLATDVARGERCFAG